MLPNKKLYGIYLTTAIIATALLFMIVSGGMVVNDISDKTSSDLAIERMKKACDKEKGELVALNPNNPLLLACK